MVNQVEPQGVSLGFGGRLVESGVDVVDGNGVVGVGCVAADIADDAELAVGRLEALAVDKGRDGLGEVDAVDEDVRLDDLGVRAVTLLGLGEIPLLDVGAANLLEQVNGARAAATEGAKDQAGGLASSDLLTGSNILFELSNQVALGVVVAAALSEGLDTGEGLAVGVGELPCPGLLMLLLASVAPAGIEGNDAL